MAGVAVSDCYSILHIRTANGLQKTLTMYLLKQLHKGKITERQKIASVTWPAAENPFAGNI